MKEIPLTQGKVALVSDEDYERVSAFKWHAHKMNGVFYAARKMQLPDGKRTTQYLHRFLLGLAPGDARQGDHVNGNTLDNRQQNLRIVTHAQNKQAFRREKADTASSKFRGVHLHKRHQKWEAYIKPARAKKLIHLGYFDDELDAAGAYDSAAIKLFGSYAQPNFNNNQQPSKTHVKH